MIKVLFLLGTRPEAIKLIPVIKEFKTRKEFDARVCTTGQHRSMIDQVFKFFDVMPDFDLDLMKPGQTLPDLTSSVLTSVTTRIFSEYMPDWVVVQGDTTTAMAGAMASFYAKIKVAHVEAGLRSNNMASPFPEEMNRVVISRMATLHFCPTKTAMDNLRADGITQHVHEVGNTVIDAAQLALKELPRFEKEFSGFFSQLDLRKKIILVTCHRRESFGTPFIEICNALRDIADLDESYQVVYPLHLNPFIQENARKYLGGHPRIFLMDPLSYPHLLWLLDHCSIVLTDSGGIQEEAPSFKKPVLVMREVTERMEGIKSGSAILVGTNRQTIVNTTRSILHDKDRYIAMVDKPNPYGDGKASQRIADILIGLK